MITLSTMLITGIAAGVLTGYIAYEILDSLTAAANLAKAAPWALCVGFPLGILTGGLIGKALQDRFEY